MSRLNSTAALAGFIVNNGIVMIDKIEINWREGQASNDAVVSSRDLIDYVASLAMG